MTFTTTPTATASAATRGGPAALGLALMAALGVTALLSSGTNISSTSVELTAIEKEARIQTTNVELTAIEKEARTHTLEDQQKFLGKHADVAAIKMVDTMPATSIQLFHSEKTPEMLENNCLLNQLFGVYKDCEAAYREDKGDTFVDGPVNDFTTNYANAKSGLDDEMYMKVASAKSRADLMFFYVKTCHIVDICTYRKEEQNEKTVAEYPVLFMPSEAQCSKATQAKDEFEKGAGATLLQERDPECASPTTTTTTAPGLAVAGNGMGTQCIMVDKDKMGPLQVPEDGDKVATNLSGFYQGCHEKLNDWAKISPYGACVISSASNSYHRRCHCKPDQNVDCKAMCAGDSGCLGYVERINKDGKFLACQWATISDAC